MPETLAEMTARVRAFQSDSVPEEAPFGLAPSLREKVSSETGGLLPFFGSTVVHFLDEEIREVVAAVMDQLYDGCGAYLSARLPAASLHVTLHDLRAAARLEEVAGLMSSETRRASELTARARDLGPVEMRLTTVFNLVNTSVAIGLLPASERDHERLTSARALFDEIVDSGPFTPHLTLAYYHPGVGRLIDPRRLSATLDRLTRLVAGRPVTLHPDRLQSCHFSDMATYWEVGSARPKLLE